MLAVTGATGFVGRAVCARAAVAGEPVRRIGRRDAPGLVGVGDLGPDTDWHRALDGIETVIHLAARVHHMHERQADPLPLYRRTNVDGTLHLARSAHAAGVKRIVFVSSVKVMGEKTLDGCSFNPDDLPKPEDAYGISKYEAEQGLWKIAAETGLEVCVVRPPLVYGPDVGANFRALVTLVKSGLPLPFASIRNKRSLIAVDNLADLLLRCARRSEAVGQTFFCRDDREFSTPELLHAIGRALSLPIRLFPMPPSWMMALATVAGQKHRLRRLTESLQVDDSSTRARLDWAPPLTADQALSEAALTWRARLN